MSESKCSLCQKSFACRRYLVKHVTRVHSKEKEDRTPLECAICGKCFPRLSHLQRHQLIHIKEREWGCPFCEQSFVQKPHLIRHIGRCHGSQCQIGLEERIAANKWRTEDGPVEVELPKHSPGGESSSKQCADLVPRLLCIQCGATFDNRTDLERHTANRHRSLKCRNCGETFDGYASLRAHELRQRSHAHVCSCGASFTRESELRAHRDSCRKRGSFLCLVCDRVFTQRIQLDRHWNKEHFSNAQCGECGWIAAAPLRKAEHALDVHKKRVCGYCDAEDPADDHVSTEHWKRLRKSIPVQKLNKRPVVECDRRPITGATKPDEVEEVALRKHATVDAETADESLGVTGCGTSSTTSASGSDTDAASNSGEEAKDADHGSNTVEGDVPSVTASVPCEPCYLNVVLSVPDEVVDEFCFGDRLPAEIRRLFPELVSARVCIVEPFDGQKRFLSLHIPVTRPLEADAEAERLLTVPIYV